MGADRVAATRDIATSARSLLVVEVVSVLLILALMAVVVVRLAAGDAPAGQRITGSVLDLPGGTSLATVGLAATAGFLSFAGFESAGSLGEEADRPTDAIPRSMVLASRSRGLLHRLRGRETWSFGTDAAGRAAFAGSGAPLSALADAYVGDHAGDVLALAALVSAIGAGLGCASVGARMLFALGRDRRRPAGPSAVSGADRRPGRRPRRRARARCRRAVAFAVAGTEPMRVFFYFATFRVLNLLVMYILTNVAAIRLLASRRRPVEALLPVAGIAVAASVLYRNVWPVPDHRSTSSLFVAGWIAIGVVWALVARTRCNAPPGRGTVVHVDRHRRPPRGSEPLLAADPADRLDAVGTDDLPRPQPALPRSSRTSATSRRSPTCG